MPHATNTTALPSEADALAAKEAGRTLASHMRHSDALRLRILDDPSPEAAVTLPARTLRLLLRILEETARGNAVTVIPVHAELTTQEAAAMLNISRPSLIRLLDAGEIEFRRVGTHRRVRFEALMAYKRRADAARRAALEELAAYDQQIGI